MKAQIRQYLDDHFSQFDNVLKETIAEKATLKSFVPGDLVMRPGQYFQATMLIATGRVKLYREGEDGGEFFVYFIEAGSACALSMICAAKNEQSAMLAMATEKTTAILIPITLMDELMQHHKSWYYFVLSTYRQRFEELLQVIDSIAFKSMDERLAYYLKTQSTQLGSQEIPLTHQQIADDLNSSREVISRLLKTMERDKKLILKRSIIQLLTK